MNDFQALHEVDVYPSPHPQAKNSQFYNLVEPISLEHCHVNRSCCPVKDLSFLFQILNPMVRGGKFIAINITHAPG